MPSVRRAVPRRLANLAARRLWAQHLGLGALLALLAVSAFWAYRIQQELADDTDAIYSLHVLQDDDLQKLRRTLWQTSILARDFLLNPAPDRDAQYESRLERLKSEATATLLAMDAHGIPDPKLDVVRAKLDEFWTAAAAVPNVTHGMGQAQRYEFLQSQIAQRRVALSDLLQEITTLTRSTLADARDHLNTTQQSASRNLLFWILLSFAAGLAFAWISLRQIRRAEAETMRQFDDLARAKSDLQALSNQLMSLQETERARLSRELHDEIGQSLATLRLELARLESAAAAGIPDIHARLERSRNIVDAAVKTVRNISLMLRPSLLDDLGLTAALQWLTEDFTRRTAIITTLRDANIPDDLPAPIRTCIFRIAQEALHNIEKHAGASRVEVDLTLSDSSLGIAIRDDGRGIDAEDSERWKTGAHLGILGMQERVAAVDGLFSISPLPHRGTLVSASIPLAAGDSPSPLPEEVEA